MIFQLGDLFIIIIKDLLIIQDQAYLCAGEQIITDHVFVDPFAKALVIFQMFQNIIYKQPVKLLGIGISRI